MCIMMIHSDARDYGTAQVRRDLCITAPTLSVARVLYTSLVLSSILFFFYFFFSLSQSITIVFFCNCWKNCNGNYGQMSVYPRRCQGYARSRFHDAISAPMMIIPLISCFFFLLFNSFVIAGFTLCVCYFNDNSSVDYAVYIVLRE